MAMQETDEQQLSEDERRLLDELLSEDLDEIPGFGEQRRNFLKQIATASRQIYHRSPWKTRLKWRSGSTAHKSRLPLIRA
jgi:hypothetical protein